MEGGSIQALFSRLGAELKYYALKRPDSVNQSRRIQDDWICAYKYTEVGCKPLSVNSGRTVIVVFPR